MYSHKVLVVDDNYVNRRVVKQVINSTKHSFIGEAQDGFEAIQMIEQLQPTVITLDLNMPKRNGYEVLEILKDKYPKLPVIVITGERSEEKQQHALQLGALHLIRKPFQPPYLITRLENTPLIEGIYEIQPEISDDFELVISSEIADRPHRDIEIRNAKTQIGYGEDKEPDHITGEYAFTEKTAAVNKSVILDVEVEDDLAQTSSPKKAEVILTDEIEVDTVFEITQPSTQDVDAVTSTVQAEEEPFEVIPLDHRSIWRQKNAEEQHQVELVEEVIEEPPPALTENEKAITTEYEQELFVLYEQDETPTEATQTTSTAEHSSQQTLAIGERFNSSIRPPISQRRPLTADETHRVSQYQNKDMPENYVIHNSEDESVGKKKEGLFARLFGSKKQ